MDPPGLNYYMIERTMTRAKHFYDIAASLNKQISSVLWNSCHFKSYLVWENNVDFIPKGRLQPIAWRDPQTTTQGDYWMTTGDYWTTTGEI